ncbi:TPA: phage protein NinX family protein [Pseudomonas putida]
MPDLIEVSAANLSGEALGWAVGMAEGLDVYLEPPGYNGVPWRVFARHQGQAIAHTKRFNPWEDWAVGGPLIDKHRGGLQWNPHMGSSKYCYSGGPGTAVAWLYGPTPLVAFFRSLVKAKLGDAVQVPKELCQ